MRVRLAIAVLGLASALSARDAQAQEVGCTEREQEVSGDLALAALAMEPEARVLLAFGEAAQGIRACPSDEKLWYLLLRAAELGGGAYPVDLPGGQARELKVAAEAASQRFPNSARIATARARVLGTLDAARQAVVLDPSYVPAQVALGAALLRAGDALVARQVLERVPASELGRVRGGYALLARARLAVGDLDGAVAAAAKEPGPRPMNPIEPDARDERASRDAREVAGLAHLAAHRFDQAARMLLEAAAGSASARASLEHASPELRQALVRLRRGGKLTSAERSLLARILERRAQPTTAPR